MTVTSTPGRYHIAEIARLSGFSPSALRYYEQAGVLAAPERSPSGYRLYSDRDVERLRLITRAKDIGCTLEEVTDLIEAWESDECEPVKHRLRALVHDKVSEIETHLAEQAAFVNELRAAARRLGGRPLDGPCDDSCGCTTDSPPDPNTPGRTGCGCEADGVRVSGDGLVMALGLGDGPDHDAVPIACSLSGTDMATRIDDWQRLLDTVTSRGTVPGGLRLAFSDRTRIDELAQLVAAEQSCCTFFSFTIRIDRQRVELEVTAPPAGQELLATVFGDRP